MVFHSALVSGSGSVWLGRIRDQLYSQSERYRRLSVPLRTVDRDVDGEHRAIMEAMIARDADRACTLMEEHLWRTAEILMNSPASFQDEARVLKLAS
jgi:DNA-binding GntR family transcriptional regulator